MNFARKSPNAPATAPGFSAAAGAAPTAAPASPQELESDLRVHVSVCAEVLAVIEREAHRIRTARVDLPEVTRSRRLLLPKLVESTRRLRQHRCRMREAQVVPSAEARRLIVDGQNTILRAVMLDLENERLLRASPGESARTPAAAGPGPAHYVAGLYLRHRPC